MSASGLYPINRTEHAYISTHGMMGSFNQPYLMRLNAPVEEARVREGFRRLVSAHPRLRCVVEPGRLHYGFRVLADDEIVDQLFEIAWKVRRDVDLDDPAALEAFHNEILNDPLPLERGLGMRAFFLPHPQRPMLVMNIHHMLLDGRSILLLLGDLMGWLNGKAIQPSEMESRSMWPAAAPRGWRKLLAARAHVRESARLAAEAPAVQVPTKLTHNYSAHAVLHHRLAVGAAPLRARSRAIGVSLNTLLVALFAESFLRLETADPKSAAVIRLSVDMRRCYPEGEQPVIGNFVGAFLVREQRRGLPFDELARAIDAQVKEGTRRFDEREMGWTYLFEELVPYLGRTLTAYLGWKMKRAGKFPQISLHATSLGDANRINAADARLRIDEIWPVAPSLSLLFVTVEMNGSIFFPAAFQRCETDPQAVRAFLARVDDVAREIAAVSAPVSDADTARAAA